MDDRKRHIVELLKGKGAFWSYDLQDQVPPDEVLMEKGPLFLEFEDMYLLFDLYGKKKLKKFWRGKLVSQGKYLSTINWLLALYFFDVKHPDAYLKRYGKNISE